MSYVLVTGGTGTLGRALEPVLTAAHRRVRVFSRHSAPAGRHPLTWAQGDLRTGAGLNEAVRNTNTVIHLATNSSGGDAAATERLVRAIRRGCRPTAPLPHLIYLSIVGVDRIPLGYYREKLAAEQVVQRSGLPFTIVRSTQFHSLVFGLIALQRHWPVVLAPDVRLQPIDVKDVAVQLLGYTRLGPTGGETTEQSGFGAATGIEDGDDAAGGYIGGYGGPGHENGLSGAGRVPDLGGPEVLTVVDMARATLAALRAPGAAPRRGLLPLHLPGKAFAAFRAGEALVQNGPATGTLTFADFLAARAGDSDVL